jgi:hypothetical protein
MATDSFPHLPPGRKPGAQSLRERVRSPVWEWFVGSVGSAMVVAGIFLAAGGRGPGFNRGEEALGGTIFALIGLLCVFGAYVQRRRRLPLSLPRRLRGTQLTVDRDGVRRGEQLSVTLDLAEGAAKRRERLEVGLVCVERYDIRVRAQIAGGGTVVRQIALATAYQQWRVIEPRAGERTLAFEIPRDAPYSYEGEHLSYAWRVSARVVRRLRFDARIDHPIWVRA